MLLHNSILCCTVAVPEVVVPVCVMTHQLALKTEAACLNYASVMLSASCLCAGLASAIPPASARHSNVTKPATHVTS
jgi:hypothetical protein